MQIFLYQSVLLQAPISKWEPLQAFLQKQTHPADYFFAFDLKKGVSMEMVQQLIYFSQQTPVGLRKVVIIPQADQLKSEVANALLKLVEEPPSYLHIIFLAETTHLLPTILSRVQLLNISEIFAILHGEKTVHQSISWRGELEALLLEYDLSNLSQRKKVTDMLYFYPLLHSGINRQAIYNSWKNI